MIQLLRLPLALLRNSMKFSTLIYNPVPSKALTIPNEAAAAEPPTAKVETHPYK